QDAKARRSDHPKRPHRVARRVLRTLARVGSDPSGAALVARIIHANQSFVPLPDGVRDRPRRIRIIFSGVAERQSSRFLTRATETSTSRLALRRNLPKIFWIFTASCWNTACPQ